MLKNGPSAIRSRIRKNLFEKEFSVQVLQFLCLPKNKLIKVFIKSFDLCTFLLESFEKSSPFGMIRLLSVAVLTCWFQVTLTSSFVSESKNPLRQFVQCRLCETVPLEGMIADCSCEYGSVNKAVSAFFLPLLKDLTSRTFFRYFRVDLENPCPFWQENGQCFMEGCSVCACDENEIPKAWLNSSAETVVPISAGSTIPSIDVSSGWISSQTIDTNGYEKENHELGKLIINDLKSDASVSSSRDLYTDFLRDTEDDGKLILLSILIF